MIKVFVVDDHELVRCGITRLLEDEASIQVIGEASTGEEAMTLARELRPEVVLMDVLMPGIGGIEATKKMLRYDPDIKIIAITAKSEDDMYARRMLEAGASGFITKEADVNEMVTAIKKVKVGQKYICQDVAQQLALKPFVESGSPFDGLSDREMQIATMIVNCRKVQEISEDLHVSSKTVNTYRYRIFDKLEISSDVELTLMAVRHGIIDGSAIG